ncbi:ubiquinone biosynthesis O-methyltransferase, mitochondrial isoform X2 [Anabrus simplex]|uniref:ubiquinone biosynthesis O-methyltransferase, mitochondrial isoform X2 n=1 Tax=Anabrus simplex TaxID=316456 RepID=UPI0035A28FE5
MAVWTKNVHKLIPSFGIRFSQRSSVDEIDVQRLNRLADVWWNEDGEMRLLHSMNKLRIKFIVNGLVNTGRITQKDYNKPEPLEGMKLLDVGCGGGILAEPLARLGANTTGLDAGKDLIDVAKVHAAKDPALAARLCYMHNTIEEHADHNKETYDAVVASEVIEHVADKKIFVDRCVATLKDAIRMPM